MDGPAHPQTDPAHQHQVFSYGRVEVSGSRLGDGVEAEKLAERDYCNREKRSSCRGLKK